MLAICWKSSSATFKFMVNASVAGVFYKNFFFWILNLRSSRDSLGKVEIFPFEFPALNENGNALVNYA